MSWIHVFMKDRRKQLENEELLDTRLRYECEKQCPDTLQNYFFHMRRLNRLNVSQLCEAPFYSYSSLLSQQMNRVDRIQESLLRTLTEPECLCRQLQQTNAHILKEINKFLF